MLQETPRQINKKPQIKSGDVYILEKSLGLRTSVGIRNTYLTYFYKYDFSSVLGLKMLVTDKLGDTSLMKQDCNLSQDCDLRVSVVCRV